MTPEQYAAVLFLRRRGHRVEPYGRDRHMLDELIVSTSWLLDMARCEGWRPNEAGTAV